MFGFSKFQPGTGRKHFVSSRQMGIEEDSGFVVTRRCPLFTLNVAKILDFSKVAKMVRFCLLIQRKCQIRPCPSSKVNTWNHKIWASFNIGSLCSLLIFSQYFPIICIKLGPISFIEQVPLSLSLRASDEVEIRANFEKILFSGDELRCFVSKCPNVEKTNQNVNSEKVSKREIRAYFETKRVRTVFIRSQMQFQWKTVKGYSLFLYHQNGLVLKGIVSHSLQKWKLSVYAAKWKESTRRASWPP